MGAAGLRFAGMLMRRSASAVLAALALTLAACGGPTAKAPQSRPFVQHPPTTTSPYLYTWNSPGGSFPPGFTVASVSFPTTQLGWALGPATCGGSRCVVLLHTTDGGATWTSASAPPFTIPRLSPYSFTAGVFFADGRNGWVFDSTDQYQGSANQLLSTHDGGASWHTRPLPGSTATSFPAAFGAADGTTYAIMIDPSNRFDIYESPSGDDDWMKSPTTISIGAGPVPMFQLVLEGTRGWTVENDRGVVAGAQLSNGTWQAWTPPCKAPGFGDMALSQSGTSQLAALCGPSEYASNPSPATLFASTDGGASFQLVSQSLPASVASGVGGFASPAPGTFVVEAAGGIEASFDNGRSWQQVVAYSTDSNPDAEPLNTPRLAFVSSEAGYALTPAGNLLLTTDGGHTWKRVLFAGSSG